MLLHGGKSFLFHDDAQERVEDNLIQLFHFGVVFLPLQAHPYHSDEGNEPERDEEEGEEDAEQYEEQPFCLAVVVPTE